MQKQEKKENQNKNKSKLENKKLLKLKNFKRPFKIYKLFGNKNYAHIYLVIKPNNFFFGYYNRLRPKKTLILSANSLKQKITKKRVNKNLLPSITKFLALLEKEERLTSFNFVLISLILTKEIKKQVLSYLEKEFIIKFLETKKFLIDIKSLKIFNGCTPKKQRKKKRKGRTLLK